jgi:tetratricopeptide (TPR) repeat protein
MKKLIIFISAISILLNTSCRKDFTNPAAAKEDDVFGSVQAVTGVAVGLQRKYSVGRENSLYNLVTTNGFTTNELLLRNIGNTAEYQLSVGGGTVDGTNSVLQNLWTASNKIIFDANRVIEYANGMEDKAYASGLIGYTTIFKALALGDMSMNWEQVPDSIGANVPFIDRKAGFNKAISWIDNALAAVAANPPSPAFLINIPTGIDIANTLQALKARYALYAGNYALALSTAEKVNPGVKPSVFNYDQTFLNPIWETATSTNNVYQVIDSTLGLPVGLQPDLADKRVGFYVGIEPDATKPPRHRIKGFAALKSSPFPIYLGGEATLIKAECYARQGALDKGLEELNKVVTKKPAADSLGVGADLPPIAGPLPQQELLTAIYRHRCIELYMSGQKLEDMRRFNRALTERKRNFFPYPFAERDNNPNTPPDPSF